jgi:hypothetical protein
MNDAVDTADDVRQECHDVRRPVTGVTRLASLPSRRSSLSPPVADAVMSGELGISMSAPGVAVGLVSACPRSTGAGDAARRPGKRQHLGRDLRTVTRQSAVRPRVRPGHKRVRGSTRASPNWTTTTPTWMVSRDTAWDGGMRHDGAQSGWRAGGAAPVPGVPDLSACPDRRRKAGLPQ